jgi:Tol biopolymer transport system component
MSRTWTAALLLALAAAPAGAVDVELLSRVTPGRESATASGASAAAAISADGRYVAFVSNAVNLAPGITNPGPGRQLFLYDRATGTSTLVSHNTDSPDVGGNEASGDEVAISGNGRFVAFTSYATDLVPGQEDAFGRSDVFVWDRVTGATELVSRADGTRTQAANGDSYQMTISANGRFVAFTSQAGDLVDGITEQEPPSLSDVYLWDRRTGDVVPVSRSAADPGRMADSSSASPSISADGRYVAFVSLATDLVAGFTDRSGINDVDVFVWDRTTGTSVLVSHAAGRPLATGNAGSDLPRISEDGRFVAFASAATDLVPRQGGPVPNIFLWSRQSGQVVLVSHARNSLTQGVGVRYGGTEASNPPLVSADGAWVLFSSAAPNVVRNQGESTESSLDAFLWSRATGKIVMASRPSTNGSPQLRLSGLSSDGAWVLYTTTGNGQVPGVADENNAEDVFLFDRRTGKRTLVSFSGASPTRTGPGGSLGAHLSADGRWIAFTTRTSDLAPRDLNRAEDVVLQSRNGEREIVSLHAEDLASATPQGLSLVQSIDASGRFVLFTSTADASLLLPGVREANRVEDLFLYDRQLDTIQLITRSADDRRSTVNSNVGGSLRGQLSADGRFVAFLSNASDVVPEIRRALTNKVYLWDRTTGRTIWIAGFFYGSQNVAISADGSVVAFDSRDPQVVPGQVDTPGTEDVFVYDRITGTKTLVSRAAGTYNVAGNAPSSRPLLSADGRIVAYTSAATNLLAGGTTAPGQDVFLFDRQTATTTLASGAVATPQTELGRVALDLSGDGRFVLFENHAQFPGTGPNPFDSVFDLYLFDRLAGTTTLVTHTAGSLTTSAGEVVPNERASLSADGRFAAFASTMANLVPGQASPPGSANIFVFDRESGAIELVSRAAGTVATAGSGLSGDPVISADGRRVAFVSNRLDLVSGTAGQTAGMNLFVHDRITRETTLVSHSFEDPTRMSDGQCGLHVLSANGTVTAFSCSSTDLVPNDFNRFVGPQSDAFAAVTP